MVKKGLLLSLVFLWLLGATAVFAAEFSSSNFIDSNPVLTLGGGQSTSTNFQIVSGAGQIVIGESSSSNFISKAGFFYFSSASTPVLSITAGDAQAVLTWTSAADELGASVDSYSIGQSSNSGGPYSFTNVGNVLNSTVSGLTNGSTYYFVVRGLDILGDPIVTSTEVSVVPLQTESQSETSASSGGSGLAINNVIKNIPEPFAPSTIFFSGIAYSESLVSLLKDGQIAVVAKAKADASFQIVLTDLSVGNYNFVLYSQDSKGVRSGLLSIPVSISAGTITNMGGIFIPPTISTDKKEIKKGESVAIFGQSAPNSEIIISIKSDNEIFIQTKTDAKGFYSYKFSSGKFNAGSYLVKSKSVLNGQVSSYSNPVNFFITNAEITKKPNLVPEEIKVDFNGDNKVNFVDFSVLLYWYKKPLTQIAKQNFDLNKDGKINLVDFSILAYNWTG